MKIKSEIFRTFLEKISINGNVEKAKIDFKENEVTCITSDAPCFAMVKSVLRRGVFIDYKDIGVVGFGDLSQVLKWFGAFPGNEEVAIEKGENTINFSTNKKKLKIVLTDPEFIDTKSDIPELKDFKNTFTLTSVDNKSIQKNFGLFKDSNMKISLDSAGKSVTFEVGDNSKLTETIQVDDIIEDGKIETGKLLMDVLSLIDKDCTISLKGNYPVKILEQGENVNTIWIVAPIIEGDK